MQPYNVGLGDYVINPNRPANNIAGESISVRTDLNRRVDAWRCTNPLEPAHRHFFCHGFAFKTYGALGYTVFSGVDVTTMLTDEYFKVGNVTMAGGPGGILRGDVIVWWSGQMEAVHSAVIHQPVVNPGTGSLDTHLTTVNSKNGTERPAHGARLIWIMQLYANAVLIEAYRRL